MSLIYNGVALTDTTTEVIVNSPVKDPSGSDQLYTSITFSVKGYVNSTFLPSTSLSPNKPDPVNTTVKIRGLLTQPRRGLYYDNISPPGQTNPSFAMININLGINAVGRDDANGPWPDQDAFRIAYVTLNTYIVNWKCTVCLRDYPGSPTPTTASNPLSLRWEDSVSYSRDFKATYKRQGLLILSSLQLPYGIDFFRRYKLATPVRPGFQRIDSGYKSSVNGLECTYFVVDEQIRWAPPAHIISMDIDQEESSPLQGGQRRGRCSVHVVGDIVASAVDITNIARTVLMTRIWSSNPQYSKTTAGPKLIGELVIKNRDTSIGIEAIAMATYLIQSGKPQVAQTKSISPLLIPAGILYPPLGIALIYDYFRSPPATPEGRQTSNVPMYEWVGAGTGGSPLIPGDTNTYASWANPKGSIVSPAYGLGTAIDIKMIAAYLTDPGNTVYNSDQFPVTQRTIVTQPSKYPANYNNTDDLGGQGGQI